MTRTSHQRRATRLLVLLGALAAVAAVWTSAAQASWSSDPSTGAGPTSIAIGDDGSVYTANLYGSTVSKVLADGSAAAAPWPVSVGNAPSSVAIGEDGDVWVTNSGDDTVSRIDPDTGAITVIGAGTTDLHMPYAIDMGPDGSMFVANYTADSISKINADGTFAGGAWPVDLDGNTGISALGIAPDGTIYVTNQANQQMWKISATGVAASGAWPVALDAGTMFAADVTAGPDGAAYIANDLVGGVTKVLPDGTVVAGDGWPADTGVAYHGIAVDAEGDVYAASRDTNFIKRVSPTGVVETVGSTGNGPAAIAIDSAGALFSANQNANSVSKLTQSGDYHAPPATPAAPSAVAGTESATVTITPNATSARFGAPTTYTVTAVRDATKHCAITAPATSCTITGLTGGTSYTFTATATLQAWTTASSSASLPVTVRAAAPGRPTVAWSKAKRTVTALITPVAGITYRLTAAKGATTKTGTCKAVTVKGKARRRCTITLPKGAWSLAVTPTRAGTAGTAATKTYTIG